MESLYLFRSEQQYSCRFMEEVCFFVLFYFVWFFFFPQKQPLDHSLQSVNIYISSNYTQLIILSQRKRLELSSFIGHLLRR